MITLFILLCSCIFHISVAFTLEGNWTLIAVQQQNVSVVSKIDQYVFRSSLIMNRLTFNTCNSLSYQVSIDEQNFWVNIDSQLIDTDPVCSDKDIAITQSIRQTIRSVLTFYIFVDQLYLYNPSEEPVMVFNRIKISDQDSFLLNGTWIVKFKEDPENNFNLVASTSTVNACDGAIYKYTVTLPYSIKFQQQSGSCSNTKITQALRKIAFFKKFNNTLAFYDSKVSPIISGIITQTSNIAPKPSETNLALPLVNLEPPKTSTPVGLAKGYYILLLLYRRDLMRLKVQITSSTIQLNICSKLVFKYVLGQPSQISITSTDTPNRQCKIADESIYFNYIISSTSYTVDPDGLITLKDASGKSIISLVMQ